MSLLVHKACLSFFILLVVIINCVCTRISRVLICVTFADLLLLLLLLMLYMMNLHVNENFFYVFLTHCLMLLLFLFHSSCIIKPRGFIFNKRSMSSSDENDSLVCVVFFVFLSPSFFVIFRRCCVFSTFAFTLFFFNYCLCL